MCRTFSSFLSTLQEVSGDFMDIYNKPSPQDYLAHHGIKGQKWGERRGPPYPLTTGQKRTGETVKEAVAKSGKRGKLGQEILKQSIESGEVSLKLNLGNQKKHLPDREDKRRSYILGDLALAQRLILELSGTGEQLFHPRTGEWLHKERVTSPEKIGVYVDRETGAETQTDKLMILYGKAGTHVYGRKDKK